MPDRLDAALAALAIEWPPTPDIAAAVEARLEPAPPRGRVAPAPPRRRLPRPRLAWAAAALALLVAAGLAVSPSARSALLDLLGLRGARVERREPPPAPTATPGRLGAGLRLGRAVTLEEARRRAGFPLVVPASLGRPDAVWLGAGVSFVYDRRPGIPRSPRTNAAVLVSQFAGRATPVLQKAVGAGARIERLALPGARAYRISGRPHGFAWIADDGGVHFEDRRLAGATVLVERADGVLVRIEGELPRARAEALARELAGR
jgi:hypothetical protein